MHVFFFLNECCKDRWKNPQGSAGYADGQNREAWKPPVSPDQYQSPRSSRVKEMSCLLKPRWLWLKKQWESSWLLLITMLIAEHFHRIQWQGHKLISFHAKQLFKNSLTWSKETLKSSWSFFKSLIMRYMSDETQIFLHKNILRGINISLFFNLWFLLPILLNSFGSKHFIYLEQNLLIPPSWPALSTTQNDHP